MGSNPREADDIFSAFRGFDKSGASIPIKTTRSPSGSGRFPQNADEIFSGFFSSEGISGFMPMKPPPVESKLPCSLEELYSGSTKKMKISRTVVNANGRLVTETEVLSIELKPGWKKGTKITFPNKGNEQPNQLPADLVFVVDEKPHNVYRRDDNDLIINRKLSLADALAGTTLNLTTLDGRNLSVLITDIVSPGYELVVTQEGMPITKQPGTRGNLKIKFDVKFPTRLRPEQRAALRRDLDG